MGRLEVGRLGRWDAQSRSLRRMPWERIDAVRALALRREQKRISFNNMTAPAAELHEEEALGKAYDSKLAKRLLTYAWPYRKLVSASVGLLLVHGALALVGPLMTKVVIDEAIPARDSKLILIAVAAFAAALVVQLFCSYGETMLTTTLGQRIMHDLRTEIFAHLQRLPITFFDRNPVGRLVTRVTTDVEALNELFTAGVVAGLGDIFTLAAISVLMLVIDWKLALASFFVIPFVVIASNLFRVHVREAYRAIRTRIARINAYLQERLSGIRVVQLFGREDAEDARFEALNRTHRDAQLRSITIYALYFPIIEILTTIAFAGLIVVGAQRVGLGVATVGTVAAFLQLVRRFFDPLQDLSDKYNILQQAIASSERIFKLIDEPVEAARAEEARQGSANRSLEWKPGPVEVEFENVWFAYDLAHLAHGATPPAESEWVLRDVSFVARPDQTLALVGHTGAGKSTIVSLLLGFYKPQRGRILIGGRDMKEIPLDQVRQLIGYVQQDIFLFAGDVASNIRLTSDLSDEDVRGAAVRSGVHRFIERLPGGYSYALGERGSALSVGERQLLSFARAIAADPAILVLDEATSAMDSEIEEEIQTALEALMVNRTTIAIAHRLSTIQNADEIVVLHHGEIRERGTHRELLVMDGLYARLHRLQSAVSSGA